MNRYLAGSFTPATEEVTAYDLSVTGKIPAELRGRYLRNGPNALNVEDPEAHFWLSGEGMVHGVRIRDGRAEWYRNRWIRSSRVADRLGEPRRGHPVNDIMDVQPGIHVIEVAGRTITPVEGGIRPYELSYDLDTVGPCELGATAEGYSANAHTKVDRQTGWLHSLSFIPGVEAVQHIAMNETGAVQAASTIPVTGFPYMHDFALTSRYVVIYDSPVVFRPSLIGSTVPYVWDHDRPARVGLLPRNGGGEVRWYPITPGMVAHTLNAYDAGSRVVIDVVVHPEGFNMADLGTSCPTLQRWTIDRETSVVRQQCLDDRPQDFPRVNPLRESAPHRYGYSVVNEIYQSPTARKPSNAILKHDLESGKIDVHDFGPDGSVGEAVFVPSDSAKTEDDGYLMTYANNPERGAADLVILSAQDFRGEPLARVHLPVRVPLGLHGNWFGDEPKSAAPSSKS